MRKRHSPSPIFLRLAEFYIHPDIYNYWEGSPLAFKMMVKDFLIDHINRSVEPYVKSLPFLNIRLPKDNRGWLKYELEFEENVKSFLKERGVVKVYLWNKGGFKGDIIPLSSEEIKNRFRNFENYPSKGGFEIWLSSRFLRSKILTIFAHEVAHTYFYDFRQDPPKCLIPKEILTMKVWYQEFEGLAYDLGREILLPRKTFVDFVAGYKEVSLNNFLKMARDLGVSFEVLSQRLIKDLKLWDACIFWGIMGDQINGFNKTLKPVILVKCRSKRKSDRFRGLSLKSELKNTNSELFAKIIHHVKEVEPDEIREYPVTIRIKRGKDSQVMHCLLEIKYTTPINREGWFVALLRPS
jgi:hypothetical protein